MRKFHWCPLCRAFRYGVPKLVGYYAVPKICCCHCGEVLGTPESDDA